MSIGLLHENCLFLFSFALGSIITTIIYYLIFICKHKNTLSRTSELEVTVMMLNKEIEERKAAEKKLKIYATTDMMTGLLNRATGFAALEQQLLLAKRYNWPLTVCFVDIDNLKHVNDTLGHMVGDNLIIKTGHILRGYIRESDLVSRIGGDEFLVVFPKCGISEAKDVWQRVLEKINQTNLDNPEFSISLSNGFSQFSPDNPASPSTLESLIEAADMNMYQSKK